MSSFSIDVKKWAEKSRQNTDAAVREVVMTLAKHVNERSPVGDPTLWKSSAPPGYIGGHFRANNQYGFNTAPANEIDGIDANGDATIGAVQAKVMASPVAGIHYIVNNVPYAVALEEGHSTQAPTGVYKLSMFDTVNQVNYIIRKNAK